MSGVAKTLAAIDVGTNTIKLLVAAVDDDGTLEVLAREKEILERFRTALGVDGTQLGLLILRAGRGPL